MGIRIRTSEGVNPEMVVRRTIEVLIRSGIETGVAFDRDPVVTTPGYRGKDEDVALVIILTNGLKLPYRELKDTLEPLAKGKKKIFDLLLI